MADDSQRLARELRRLQRNIGNARQTNRFQRTALKTLEGLYKTRIFREGRSTRAGRIGQYSTRNMLVGAKSFRARPSVGAAFLSAKKRKWVTVKKKRLAILEGGYAKLRSMQGRQTSKVDLSLTGDLEKDIIVGKSGGNNAMGFFTDEQKKIAEAQEKRFGKDIFAISLSEQREVDRAIQREFDRLIRQTFGR